MRGHVQLFGTTLWIRNQWSYLYVSKRVSNQCSVEEVYKRRGWALVPSKFCRGLCAIYGVRPREQTIEPPPENVTSLVHSHMHPNVTLWPIKMKQAQTKISGIMAIY